MVTTTIQRDYPSSINSQRLHGSPMKHAINRIVEQEIKRLASQGIGDFSSGLTSGPEMIHDALQKKDTTPQATMLTDDEFLAIHLYSTNLYRPINHHLRYEPNPEVQPVVDALKDGLAKLAQHPDYQVNTTLYRGIEKRMPDSEIMQRFNAEKPYRDQAIMSTTTDPSIANSMTSRVSLRLHSHSAVNISPLARFPHEKEALILPNTPFHVSHMEKQLDTWHIDLEEIPQTVDNDNHDS
ncbi:ADP-ribosyltransferase domain-containing protein [Pokkaliibacter sp. MBI-7]|nr:ADP-ribosyltransferase domain-containing protein [Pokkaliibacter sp. MBI-7]MDH2433905.1 ADP-ribosyltransferase domain-containing protein [Pokkaliibacter sp. MBI-7]